MLRFRTRVAALGAAMLVAGLPAAAHADHIRVMTVRQLASSANNNEVTIRVEFQFSGNPWGGVFDWSTGEVPTPRHGAVADGLVNGAYTGDQSPTTGTFVGGGTYEWSRILMNPATNLVRIDITWAYSAPGAYVLTWNDCCPQSNNNTVVTAGQPFSPRHILAPDTGNPSVAAAFAGAEIPACDVALADIPYCYELLSAPFVALTNFNAYAAIVVGTNVDSVMVTTLTGRKADLDAWLHADAHGIAVYGQYDRSAFGFLPTGGNTLTAAPTLSNTVNVTTKGVAHTSHLNQLPVPSTLSNWNPSTLNVFTSVPSYFTNALGTALASIPGGPMGVDQTVALGGHYFDTPGCELVTGQPVDDRAAAGNVHAERLFRSTLEYVLTCVDEALL